MNQVLKSKYTQIIILGLALGLGVFLLKYLEYRYFVGTLSTEFYTTIVALIFTLIGLLIGKKILGQKQASKTEMSGEINQENLERLNLSEREYEILKLIREGLTNQEIADKLFIAVPTVKTHISKLYTKLDVNSRTLAISKANELNVL